MDASLHTKPYRGPVRAVVFDWAGTTVDYGCMGPAAVFVRAFKNHGVEVSMLQARGPMGSEKREHVRAMFAMPAVASGWEAAHGRKPSEADGDEVYKTVEGLMLQTIASHAEPVPGLLETVDALRRRGIRIGSCTGYTAPMMAVLAPEAARRGYAPDAIVTSSDVPSGRPSPWMCYLNAIALQVCPMEAMVKAGDTVADIQEGLNAGMWTVGVVRTSSDLGLSHSEIEGMDEALLLPRLDAVRERLRGAGAHFAVESVADLLPVLEQINGLLAAGENPLSWSGQARGSCAPAGTASRPV